VNANPDAFPGARLPAPAPGTPPVAGREVRSPPPLRSSTAPRPAAARSADGDRGAPRVEQVVWTDYVAAGVLGAADAAMEPDARRRPARPPCSAAQPC
jgi:hypothetical protein